MIGFAISMVIELVVLMIRLIVVMLVLTFRLIMWLVAAISAALSQRRSRPSAPRLTTATYARIPVDPDVRWAIYRRDGYACMTCGSQSDLTIDHIQAVSLGGSNDPSNLRTLCRSCNSTKGARVVSHF